LDTKSTKKKSFLGVSKTVSAEKEVIEVFESHKNWLTQFEKVEMEALEVGMQHFYMGGLAPGQATDSAAEQHPRELLDELISMEDQDMDPNNIYERLLRKKGLHISQFESDSDSDMSDTAEELEREE